jgi:hypothetical protein
MAVRLIKLQRDSYAILLDFVNPASQNITLDGNPLFTVVKIVGKSRSVGSVNVHVIREVAE